MNTLNSIKGMKKKSHGNELPNKKVKEKCDTGSNTR